MQQLIASLNPAMNSVDKNPAPFCSMFSANSAFSSPSLTTRRVGTKSTELMIGLPYLPYDLLLNIAQYLELLDIHALQLTCKVLHDFSVTRPVYRHLTYALLRRCRALPLRGFQRLSDLTTEELMQSVNKADRSERAWRVRAPRPIGSGPNGNPGGSSKNWYKIVTSPPGEEIDWLSPITSSYTLCATKSGKVVCWDVLSDSCLAEWNPGERRELWKCRVEFEERTVFFTMAKVISGSYDDERVMEFVLMRLDFPEDSSSSSTFSSSGLPRTPPSPPIFSNVSQFKTTGVVMNVFLLEPRARLLSAFIWVSNSNTIGLYVLLDWDRPEYVFVDTGIVCQMTSNWSCILYETNIVIHSEESEAANQHFYPIEMLKEYERTLDSTVPRAYSLGGKDRLSVPAITARLPPNFTISRKFAFPKIGIEGDVDFERVEQIEETEIDLGSDGGDVELIDDNEHGLISLLLPDELWEDVHPSPLLSSQPEPQPQTTIVVPVPPLPSILQHPAVAPNFNPFPFPPWYPESAHFVRQWWPTLSNIPKLSCTVVLLASHDPVTHRTKFVLGQHYFRVPIVSGALDFGLGADSVGKGTGDGHETRIRGIEEEESEKKRKDEKEREDLALMRLWYVSEPFEVVCVLDGTGDEMEEMDGAEEEDPGQNGAHMPNVTYYQPGEGQNDDGDGGVQIPERPRPLVAVDFGHAVWIEYCDPAEPYASRASSHRNPRPGLGSGSGEAKCLRFVTFPPVGEDTGSRNAGINRALATTLPLRSSPNSTTRSSPSDSSSSTLRSSSSSAPSPLSSSSSYSPSSIDSPSKRISGMRRTDGVVRTLEIPAELDLDSVETINIDQSQGAVILSVREGKIFILCYE